MRYLILTTSFLNESIYHEFSIENHRKSYACRYVQNYSTYGTKMQS